MTAIMPTSGNRLTDVIALKEAYKNHWRDMPESYWFMRLAEELGELGGVLAGNHDDTVEHELKQIAAICLNWLEMRDDRLRR